MIELDRPTGQSIHIEVWDSQRSLATASGFIARYEGKQFLVTNRHVVTGLNQTNNHLLWSNVPEKLLITLHDANLSFAAATIILNDEDFSRLWFEHPIFGSQADIVALELPTSLDLIPLNAYDLDAGPPPIHVGPSDLVSIVGFPFGLRASGFPIWSAGFVASEPALDYDNRPLFLIDSRTRPGQSGSPVIAYRGGGMIRLSDGGAGVFRGPVTLLMGIYSGRVNEESDLGFVWKTAAIRDLIAAIPS